MIIKIVDVSIEIRPEPLGIYWGVPWGVDDKILSQMLTQMRADDLEDLCKSLNFPYHCVLATRANGKPRYNQLLEQHREDIISKLEGFTTELVDNMSGIEGLSPNRAGKLRIMVNDHPVGIFPHEFSILTEENMSIYLEDHCHELCLSGQAEEELEHLTKEQKPIYEASLLDGCNHYEATLNSMGKKIVTGFPPAIGWYKPHPDLVAQFF
jgi:hypothetical protein